MLNADTVTTVKLQLDKADNAATATAETADNC
jgi:hypothetical protein